LNAHTPKNKWFAAAEKREESVCAIKVQDAIWKPVSGRRLKFLFT